MFAKIRVTALEAVLAGFFIGIAGTVYLAVPNPMLGAFMFGFGLVTIVCYNFKLFTGAVGYFAAQKRQDLWSYLLFLLVIWLGNLAGTFAVGRLIRCSRTAGLVVERATNLCKIKQLDCWESWLILSFFCGILMYLAVESSRRKEELPSLFRFALIVLCVAVFILSGFEHCIANMYYFSVAGEWNITSFGAILVMTLGNSLGGMMLVIADKFRK